MAPLAPTGTALTRIHSMAGHVVAMRDGDQDAAKGETVKYAILVMTSQHNEIVAVDMDE